MHRTLLALSIFVLANAPDAARACSGLPECSAPTGTIPPDGAVDVPLNVELEALVPWYAAASETPLRLRVAESGEEVRLVPARTPGRMRSEAPLSANTRYELFVPREVASYSASSSTCDETLVARATFTTGSAIDDTAPTSLTASGGGCSVDVCTNDGCCGPYVAAISGATWSAIDDGALPVAYAFGSPEGRRTLETRGGGAQRLAGMFIGGGPLAGGGRVYVGASPVFAIDAAGNVSEVSAPFALDFSCAPSSSEAERLLAERLGCDGGPCGSLDAGADATDAGATDAGGDAAAEPDARSSSSCTVTRGASAPGVHGLATLVGLALLARSRRRRA